MPRHCNNRRKSIAVLEVCPGIGEPAVTTRDLAVMKHDNAGSFFQRGSVPSGITAVSKHASPRASYGFPVDAVAFIDCWMVYRLAGFDLILIDLERSRPPPCVPKHCETFEEGLPMGDGRKRPERGDQPVAELSEPRSTRGRFPEGWLLAETNGRNDHGCGPDRFRSRSARKTLP
jgi:hypothetical protein